MDMAPEDVVLECRGVNQWFGARPVLHDINFRVKRGSIVSVVGPSGCGKSTLLRAIVGIHPPTSGRILVYSGAQTLEVRRPSRERGIVFQRYSVFPFMTAQENVALGLLFHTSPWSRLLRPRRWRRLRRRHMEEAADLLTKLGLADAMALYPHQLSGGMCQRIALAQALIIKPEILVLDEPFGALDNAMRENLQRMLLRLHWESRRALEKKQTPVYTFLLVTHQIDEAIFVGDRVLGLSQHWDWAAAGHKMCPGATIVYDAPTPEFGPDHVLDNTLIATQQDDICEKVFQSETPGVPEPAPYPTIRDDETTVAARPKKSWWAKKL